MDGFGTVKFFRGYSISGTLQEQEYSPNYIAIINTMSKWTKKKKLNFVIYWSTTTINSTHQKSNIIKNDFQ